MDINQVLVWVQVGQQRYQVAKGPLSTVRAALEARGIEADNAQLDLVATGYAKRIARAEAAAAPPVEG